MRVRRSFLYIALAGCLLWSADSIQRSVYVNYAPVPAPLTRLGESGPRTSALLIAGEGLDEVETATSLRDIDNATDQLLEHSQGQIEIRSISPNTGEYSNDSALDSIRGLSGEHVILYLTGHGGGKNFGAVGGLNLQRNQIASALGEADFRTATVVVDCCWSGEFTDSFREQTFPGEVTLVTSTDAEHPSPFPVSFLSPKSFGRMFFDRWDQGPAIAFEETNRLRVRLESIYDVKFGLTGTLTTYPSDG